MEILWLIVAIVCLFFLLIAFAPASLRETIEESAQASDDKIDENFIAEVYSAIVKSELSDIILSDVKIDKDEISAYKAKVKDNNIINDILKDKELTKTILKVGDKIDENFITSLHSTKAKCKLSDKLLSDVEVAKYEIYVSKAKAKANNKINDILKNKELAKAIVRVYDKTDYNDIAEAYSAIAKSKFLDKLFSDYEVDKDKVKTIVCPKSTIDSDEELEKYNIEYIYHITHYRNLENILKKGLFPHNKKLANQRIDNEEVNLRRDKKDSIYLKNLHEYVPFYFNPKNPMLFVQKQQKEIIILAFSRKILLKKGIIFTDGNAAVSNTKFYNKINDLKELSWDCIDADYWSNFENGKIKRMAETLVPDFVKIEDLEKIYCYSNAYKEYI